MVEYKHRVIDKILKRKLEGIGAVLIEGPKLCGKTTSAEHMAESILYMAKPDEIEQNIKMAELKPSLLLEGNTPRLIDEWQAAPRLWDAVRFEVDHRGKAGQFILTGSAVPANRDKIRRNNSWDVNYGYDGVKDGDNIMITITDYYYIYFEESTGNIWVDAA